MGALYIATPGAGSGDATEVTTGTSTKTLLQVATPSTTSIRVFGWGVSFDGTSSTAVPGRVVLVDTDVAATVTTLTADKWESPDASASLCVGGSSATGYNASAEGTIGSSARLLDPQHVHSQSGYAVWFPADARPLIKPSRFLRIRCSFGASINAIPWVVWSEPI